MTKEKSKGNQITEGIIWQQLLFFFFPILFGTFFQQLYNAADAMIVGRFVGKEALSAVGGSTSMLTQLIVGFFVGLSSGASVIVSQYYGAKRPEMVGYAVHTALMFSILSGIVLMFVGIGLAPFLFPASLGVHFQRPALRLHIPGFPVRGRKVSLFWYFLLPYLFAHSPAVPRFLSHDTCQDTTSC